MQDNKTDNWWLRVNDIDLGYWPSSLFGDYLKSSATFAQWGGEVYSPDVRKSPHTTTAMGSGSFAEDLFNVACYIAHIRVMDFSYTWKYPQYVGTYSDEWNCYSAYHYVPGYMTEPTLFFGGPGQNPRCP
uniref:Neprosin PEP catalytic domain-containing protein n=2 Tax=Opuntia streptacantha TaxID=393608 RepID=A0A7C9DYW5_OPUST